MKKFTKFNIGDEIEFRGYSVSCDAERELYLQNKCPARNDERHLRVGEIYKVIATNDTEYGFFIDIQGKGVMGDNISVHGCSSSSFIIKLNNTNMMNKLTTAMRRVLSKGMQSQYKAGLRNGQLELTERGRQEILEILAQEKEQELTKIADEILKEESDR